MKPGKSALLCSFVLLSISLRAQNSKPIFGLTAGATFASYKVTVDGISVSSNIKTGFTVGALASFGLGGHFSFQPALNFLQKGGVLHRDQDETTNNARYYYLELPLNFIYHPTSAREGFFVGAGPSLSMGLSGKYEITGMYTEKGDIHFGGSEDDDLKPFEVGVNVLTGYTFKCGLMLAANFNLGLNNISDDNDGKFHNQYFGVRLGYLFK